MSTLRRYDLYGIHFDFDKARMRPESAALIKDVALTPTHNPTWTLQINGHTHSIGDQAYNQNLSAARAKAVADALIKRGIAARRLQTAGLGSSQPKDDNWDVTGPSAQPPRRTGAHCGPNYSEILLRLDLPPSAAAESDAQC